MAFEKIVPMWEAAGTEPSEELKKGGFTAGYKPPADVFNWFFHMMGEAVAELQGKALSKEAQAIEEHKNLDDYTAVGIYTYAASTSATITNVPEQSQGTLFVMPRLTNSTSGNRIQVVITQNNNIYVRNDIDGVWNDWRKMFDNDDVIPVSNGGTGGNTPAKAREALGAAAVDHGRHITDNCTLITDWNNATANGWYMSNDGSNAPTIGNDVWYFGYVIAHNSNYVLQEVYQFTSSAEAKYIPKYIRAKMNGAWGGWADVSVQTKVPSNAILNGAKVDLSNVTTEDMKTKVDSVIVGKTIGPCCVELSPASGENNGGFIDFHYGGKEGDYTARIIESSEGRINAIGVLAENGARVYSPNNKPNPNDINAFSKDAVSIGENADLNDYTTIGMYIYSASAAASLTNAPEVAQGTLIVLPRLTNTAAENRIQIVITMNENVYLRNLQDGVWHAWVRFNTTPNSVATTTDPGAGVASDLPGGTVIDVYE